MDNIDSYKGQATTLILLNFAVLAALFFVHISFITLLGRPSASLLLTLAIRFVLLVFELLWVQRLSRQSRAISLTIHIYLSIILNIAFAFLASIFGGTADSHYAVLMIIPIISAAYRFSIVPTLLVAAVTIVLTFLEVWLFFRAHPPADVSEYFEAATVSLVFLVIAVVVWSLVGNLRGQEEKVLASLAELQRMQEKLVAEEKLAAIGQLSGAIAHEIRNPVTMIASSLKMAESQQPDSPIRKEMFEIATHEANRLETLTTDFLAFARSKDPVLETAAAGGCLDYIASLTKARLIEKDLELRVVYDGSLAFKMDSSLMQQALLNLVVNAIDATRRNRTITLGAEKDGAVSVFFVENEGEKIPDEIVTRIFEPFFTSGKGGTGLGLSIVRNIARAHGGDVYLAENNNDKVRFEIRF